MIINAYKRRSVLIAQNADVAQASGGVTYLRFMKSDNTHTNVFMLTADTFVHGEETSIDAHHCSVEARRLVLWNAILALTKQ